MSSGAALHAAGRLDEALRQFEQAREIDPAGIGPVSACASVLADMALPQAAWQTAQSARASLLGNADGAVNLGVIAECTAQFDEAAQAYEHALTLDPDNVRALNNLSLLRARTGAWAAAIELAERCVELRPSEPMFALTLCDVLVAAREYDKALMQLDAALSRFKGNTSFVLRKAVALAMTGQLAEARVSLKQLGWNANTRLRDYLRHSRPNALRAASFDVESVFLKRCADSLRAGDESCLPALQSFVVELQKEVARTGLAAARDWQDLLALSPFIELDDATRAHLQASTSSLLAAQARFFPAVPPPGWSPAEKRIRVGLAVPALDNAKVLLEIAAQIRAVDSTRFAVYVYGLALPTRASAENADAIGQLRSVAANIIELLFLEPVDMAMRLRMDRLDVMVDTTHNTPWSIELLMHAKVATLQVTTDTHRVAPLAPYDAKLPDLPALDQPTALGGLPLSPEAAP